MNEISSRVVFYMRRDQNVFKLILFPEKLRIIGIFLKYQLLVKLYTFEKIIFNYEAKWCF